MAEQPLKTERVWIRVGLGSCGMAAGGIQVLASIRDGLERRGLAASVSETGCLGLCFDEVLVEVSHPATGPCLYARVTPERTTRILEEHVAGGKPVAEWLSAHGNGPVSEDPLLGPQIRIALRDCGRIDPDSLSEYRARGGYAAAASVIGRRSPEEVLDEMERSGLRGRGGGGFPTARKWRFAREAPGIRKYIICNGDEGDPGAFMDRSILEGDPHAVLEGMLLAGWAIGASSGLLYVRAEYPMALYRLRRAISSARAAGFLGRSVLGSGYDFDVTVMEGAGAFVCGEETALLASVEGRRGMPRMRPPFPVQNGLYGCPTVINNVETLAVIPWILSHGAEAFSGFGTPGSRGTKVFALAGKVVRGGLVEVPMGTTLRRIVFDIGGGIPGGRKFKAVQLGGPSGGCLPESLLDTPVDYESLQATGAIMGSGGMVVMDDATCMVDVARFFLRFTQEESCGKCTLCRIGTRRMLEILERITEGTARDGDLSRLEELALRVKSASLCGLGQTAPNPVLTTLRHFRDEYEAHVRDRRCPARVCKALLRFGVDSTLCNGCGLCRRICPAGAIEGETRRPHRVDESRCVKCGECLRRCRFGAITVE